MTAFFNTELKTGSLIENMGNFFFVPVRVLFEGKSYTKVDNVFLSQESHEKSGTIAKIIKISLAVLLLIPGVILGSVFKGLAYLQCPVREAADAFQAAINVKRVLIEGETTDIELFGEPKELDPSIDSFQRGVPYDWLEENIPSPRKMDLSGLKPHIAERVVLNQDLNSLVELDLSNTGLVEEQLLSIIKRCPKLQVLKSEGLEISQEAFDTINKSETLSDESRIALGRCIV